MSDTRFGFGNGVRVIGTKMSGKYAVRTVETNCMRISRVVGRRNAIRQGQHTAASEKVTSRR